MTAERLIDARKTTIARSSASRGAATAIYRVLVIVTFLPLCGCHVVYPQRSSPIADAVRTIVYDPLHFPLHRNDYLVRAKNRLLARKMWSEVASAAPGQTYSKDYVKGFVDGFSDYLYAGGTGEPPPVPPSCYWKVGYETSAGRQAIEDWFAGFRHGASVCCESGYRDLAVMPSSVYAPAELAAVPADSREATIVPDSGYDAGEIELLEPIMQHAPELVAPLGTVERLPEAYRPVGFGEPVSEGEPAEEPIPSTSQVATGPSAEIARGRQAGGEVRLPRKAQSSGSSRLDTNPLRGRSWLAAFSGRPSAAADTKTQQDEPRGISPNSDLQQPTSVIRKQQKGK